MTKSAFYTKEAIADAGLEIIRRPMMNVTPHFKVEGEKTVVDLYLF